MTLAFLNPTRSFDEARNAIRFCGHDGMFEIQFFVEVAALAQNRVDGSHISEAEYLLAFDRERSSIEQVARAIYSNHHRNLNTLAVSDFEGK